MNASDVMQSPPARGSSLDRVPDLHREVVHGERLADDLHPGFEESAAIRCDDWRMRSAVGPSMASRCGTREGPPASENAFVNAEFLSTMRVTGFRVLDSNGAPVFS